MKPSININTNHFFYILSIAAVFLVFFSNCKNYKALKSRSYSHIEILKNNTLLVRLKTSQHKIEAFKKGGNWQAAEKEQKRIATENQESIRAFTQFYTFSNVYFFYSNESGKLKNKQYEQVSVFNSSYDTITNPSFLEQGYLVADFTSVYQDQLYTRDENDVRYPVSGTSGLPALVLMDADYIQLGKPFPFRVVFDDSNTNNKEGAVRNLNDKLNKYYARYERKRLRQQKRSARK